MTTTTLVKKWIHILDNEYGICGQITMEVGPSHFLVAMRPCSDVPPISQLMKIDNLCDRGDDYRVSIFDDEAAMDKWLAAMEEGEPAKIVRLK